MSDPQTNVKASTAADPSWESALNLLLEQLIPNLNELLPKLIVEWGYDPWKTVVSGSESLGKINLGICTAKAKCSYSIKNMVGLSSMYINSATILDISGSDPAVVTGTLKLDAKLKSNLSASVSGSIKASCGAISEKVSLSGSVKAKGVTGTATGTFKADLSGKVCLNDVNITALSLKYDDIDVKINGLGFFNDFLDEVVDLIDEAFGDAIEDEISKALKPLFNELMDDVLPYCIAPAK